MSLLLLDEVGSTQDELVARARRGERVDAVATGWQTGGRGRFGRPWLSAPGASLALSVLRPMPVPTAAAPFVGMALAVRAAERYGVAVQWPNDVTFGGRKVAGILVEVVAIDDAPHLVVGIGVNLEQESFPPEIAHRATSLRLATGRRFEWSREAAELRELARLPAPREFAELAALWSRRDETLGKLYRAADGELRRARGIDSAGRLLLEGEARPVSAAEAYFGLEIPAETQEDRTLEDCRPE